MSHLQDVEEIPYPPAPWKCSGQIWIGIFKSHAPRPLPDDFKHLFDPHLFVVSLIRYLDGTLRYDEILFSTPARLGARIGTHVDDIWVNDLASLWGGRRIWGLPKNLADFKWDESTVHITDDHGLIAKISVDMRPARSPLLWMPIPGFGHLDQAWTYYVGSLWAHFGKAGMQIVEWPERFAALQNTKPSFSVAAKPFVEMQVPPPKILRSKSPA
ncbi:MAG: acetoacetate decarboxylase family protein [Anaerolineales bacterium]|nr:acetoacetate decarboxylase family protein [Anaerolineales bacterium]